MDHREGLKRLQNTDLEIFKAEQALAGLPSATREAEDGITKLQAIQPKVAAALEATQTAVRVAEGEVSDLQDKLIKVKARLKQASTAKAAEAVQHEITSMQEKINAAEEVVLEKMEAEEQAQAQVDKVAAGIASLEKRKVEIREGIPARKAELEATVEKGREERQQWIENIDETNLKAYEDQAAKNPGKRIVVEVEEACAACDKSFTSDYQETLMRNMEVVHRCPKCGALMIYTGPQQI
jgi:predicted  nucleic acid-binding Zn-ribbon protein